MARHPAAAGLLSAAGVLATFPPLGWTPLAAVAWVPVIAGMERGPGAGNAKRWLGAGWGFGLAVNAVQYHWLVHALLDLAGVSPGRFLPFWLAAVALLALVPAVFLGLCAWARARLGWSVHWTLPLALCGQDALLGVFPFGGMPWGSPAAPQAHTFLAGWLLPVVGGPGLLLALGGLNSLWALWLGSGHLAPRAFAARGALLGLLTTALLLPWSGAPYTAGVGAPVAALLVQGDAGLPGSGPGAPLRYYLGRTLEALARGGAPDSAPPPPGGPGVTSPRRPLLVVWPESAAGEDVTRGKTLADLSALATVTDADFLLGSDTRLLGRSYNSLFLVTGGRFDFRRYDKRALVPFGEYVPVGFRWAFGRKVTAGDQDYTAGAEEPVLPWRGLTLGVAICFESTLPAHVARASREGAHLLVVAANDIWLTPAAREAHLMMTALRAREVERDVLFVSNGGYAAHVSAGQVLLRADPAAPPAMAWAQPRAGLTPWVRWGYWPLGGMAAALFALGVIRHTRQSARGER
jgi:apolipoprotein N-acyltransferase